MRILLHQSLRHVQVLLIIGLAACSDKSREELAASDAEVSPLIELQRERACFRKVQAFADEPQQQDVQTLIVEFDADRAFGEYHWLPAFKDQRRGHFDGTLVDDTVTARYEYRQEGQSGSATIRIRLEPQQAVVEGAAPQLGLNAHLPRVAC